MKYCEEYEALLDLYVDGELEPEEMRRVQVHLETCPGCRAYVDDAFAIRAGFPLAEDTEVPEGFAERVMERIRTSEIPIKKEKGYRRRWTGTLAALAACCAVVLLVRGGPVGQGGGDNQAAPAGEPSAYSADIAAEEAAGLEAYDGEAENAEYAEDMEPREAPAAMEEGTAPQSRMQTASGYDDFAAARYMGDADSSKETMESTAAAGLPEAVTGSMEPAGGLKLPGPEETEEDAAALYLTWEEAGSLLDSFSPMREDGTKRYYELTAGEVQTLLAALGRLEELDDVKQESGEGAVLVVVTGPEE